MKNSYKFGEIAYKYNRIATIELAIAVLFSGCAVTLGLSQNLILGVLILLNVGAFFTIVAKYAGHWPLHKDKTSQTIYSVLLIALFSTVWNFRYFSFVVTGRCVLSILLAVMLIFNFETGKDAIAAFVRVMRFYAICGLVFWVIFNVLNVPATIMPSITSSSNETVQYNSIFVYSQMVGSDRNNGVFWEPSIFAGYLALSMIFSKFYLGYSNKTLIIPILALLTTQSSGGILLLVLFAAICMWEYSSETRFDNVFTKFLVLTVAIAVLVFWDALGRLLLSINYDMFSKIFNLSTHGSSMTRLESAQIDLAIWKISPILGVGVDRMETLFLDLRNIIGTISDMAHTSTNTEYLAAFGVGGVWINWLWIKALFGGKRSVVCKMLMLCLFLLVLNESPQINFTWTYFILFSLIRINNEDIAYNFSNSDYYSD